MLKQIYLQKVLGDAGLSRRHRLTTVVACVTLYQVSTSKRFPAWNVVHYGAFPSPTRTLSSLQYVSFRGFWSKTVRVWTTSQETTEAGASSGVIDVIHDAGCAE